jgi:hypothetical protein
MGQNVNTYRFCPLSVRIHTLSALENRACAFSVRIHIFEPSPFNFAEHHQLAPISDLISYGLSPIFEQLTSSQPSYFPNLMGASMQSGKPECIFATVLVSILALALPVRGDFGIHVIDHKTSIYQVIARTEPQLTAMKSRWVV